eukprot:TRINITY_DN8493_c0_g4_i3.p1 TRINITY_DN8493_c0_g4~~TRINITY_DN8493_c0_g4_i3.p1  ORF type:complete len:233 (+),score=30.83 TRINITY_DN8493_c0_g4_i3:155-853(+)
MAPWHVLRRSEPARDGPAPGANVELCGLESRRELNGALGKVVSRADDAGLVTVRILGDTASSGKRMKVQVGRLRKPVPKPLAQEDGTRDERVATANSSLRAHVGIGMQSMPALSVADGDRSALLRQGTPLSSFSRRSWSTTTTTLDRQGIDVPAYRREYRRLRDLAHANATEQGPHRMYGNVATDVTQFARDFVKDTGIPIHKAARDGFPDVVLRNSKGQPCPPWKPPLSLE